MRLEEWRLLIGAAELFEYGRIQNSVFRNTEGNRRQARWLTNPTISF